AIYLGQDMPTSDLVKTWATTRPDFLVTHITSRVTQAELRRYLTSLSGQVAPTPVLVMGKQAEFVSGLKEGGMVYLKTPSDLKAILRN
ncbi:MAG: hypothetical protein R6V75_01475, partial [Bacteroidales bacterium]